MPTVGKWRSDDGIIRGGDLVHTLSSLPEVFRDRMKQLEEVNRWLGAYFQVVAILLQIPGGAEYDWVEENPAEEYAWDADRDMLFSILAEALERLDAASVMDQVPGADAYKPRKLPVELRLMLAERERDAVLNVVALCLDRLMVIPALADEDRSLYGDIEPRPGVWRRCWRTSVGSLRRLLRWEDRGRMDCHDDHE